MNQQKIKTLKRIAFFSTYSVRSRSLSLCLSLDGARTPYSQSVSRAGFRVFRLRRRLSCARHSYSHIEIDRCEKYKHIYIVWTDDADDCRRMQSIAKIIRRSRTMFRRKINLWSLCASHWLIAPTVINRSSLVIDADTFVRAKKKEKKRTNTQWMAWRARGRPQTAIIPHSAVAENMFRLIFHLFTSLFRFNHCISFRKWFRFLTTARPQALALMLRTALDAKCAKK